MKAVDTTLRLFKVEPAGVFRFSAKIDGVQKVVLEIRQDGSFLVDGRVAANDREVYLGFRRWLESTGAIAKRLED